MSELEWLGNSGRISGRHSEGRNLLQAGAVLLTVNKLFENGKNLLTVAVHTFQIVTEPWLKPRRFEPLMKQRLSRRSESTECPRRNRP